ncbi:MAG TPA: hypothetical protein VHQ90_11335 [Thermoanaerobaculia bacterium]|nr:hypothetical protein [Thermoanaerobaculia bacterium]
MARLAQVSIDVKAVTQRAAALAPLRAELRALRQKGPESGLLALWLRQVAADHERLAPYFQRQAETELLERVYVQLELRTETGRAAGPEPTSARPDHPLGLREVLGLDRAAHPWVTGRWVVLGDPGAGKTTLLRDLSATLARQPDRTWVPLYESLPRLVREGRSLLDRVVRRLGLPASLWEPGSSSLVSQMCPRRSSPPPPRPTRGSRSPTSRKAISSCPQSASPASGWRPSVSGPAAASSWRLGIGGLSFLKHRWRFHLLDWLYLAAGLVVFVYYLLSENPTQSAILATATDVLGYGSTIRKGWAEPDKDSATSFALNSAKFVPALFALESYSLATWLYPGTLVVVNGFVAVMLVWRRQQLASRSR